VSGSITKFAARGSGLGTPYTGLGPPDALLKERSMRMMTATVVLALLMESHTVDARDGAGPVAGSSGVLASKAYTPEESAAMAKAARAKAQVQERLWDRKMKILMRGICSGC
jgi:hypothetical protein